MHAGKNSTLLRLTGLSSCWLKLSGLRLSFEHYGGGELRVCSYRRRQLKTNSSISSQLASKNQWCLPNTFHMIIITNIVTGATHVQYMYMHPTWGAWQKWYLFKPQVSMIYRLINDAGCWEHTTIFGSWVHVEYNTTLFCRPTRI